MAEKTKVTIAILVAIIIVLASIISYTFVIKPKITGYVAQDIIEAIVMRVKQDGFVQISFGNETLILVPYQPQKTEQTQTE